MGEAMQPSAELEEAIQQAASLTYGSPTIDMDAVSSAMTHLLNVDASVVGSSSQQLMLGTLVLDFNPPEEEGEPEAMELDEDDNQLPLRIMHPHAVGRALDPESLSFIAATLLLRRNSARDAVMGYCALRMCDKIPTEGGELHAVNVARAVSETTAVTDTLTRVYSRRVLALVAEQPDDVFAVVRQAQDESNPFEVVRLVESSYRRLPPERALSLLALGVNAASDMNDEEEEFLMIYRQFDVALMRFNTLYNQASCDEEFERNAEARSLVGEIELFAEAFGRAEGYEQRHMYILMGLAFAQAVLLEREEAEIALLRLQQVADEHGGIPESIAPQLRNIREILDRNGPPPNPPSREPNRDDDDDERNDPANAWKFN